ncbi:16S rRNA (cytosine1402-N4)-methyltransferase [Seinonella peptonophila]|uniref:Ribosomal RNA small subunit methyltransferase H n=1 Tax=Seinonella peptonophila TaxID=112248 RepID=A0A1M4UZY6_9BACL|nr:16S rRNA (cytosine(1402)-N(4))-methyltransferase RsmH [Seinonella peptonophila]SHE62311.1 16S rRNA (cytosine1402-N4)-methyltransferase [Seinonella peptonophila]
MFVHETVLKQEAVEGLALRPDGVYVDCTLGGAGHSLHIASKLSSKGTLVGLDQDQTALDFASQRLLEVDCQIHICKANFRHLKEVLQGLSIDQVDGILFDLGVSSPQLDQGERGFSYHTDAPLDMRMDREQKLTAYDIVNHSTESELADLIYRYGEERFSRRISAKIVAQRPIERTLRLAEVIKQAIPAPARRTGPHPARKTFQAIRIAVNDELQAFQEALSTATSLLRNQGRICVITFHSLEDRICKRHFQTLAKGCTCPPTFPVCMCGKQPELRLISRKPILPSTTEIKQNPRARSAKLRVAEKIE